MLISHNFSLCAQSSEWSRAYLTTKLMVSMEPDICVLEWELKMSKYPPAELESLTFKIKNVLLTLSFVIPLLLISLLD